MCSLKKKALSFVPIKYKVFRYSFLVQTVFPPVRFASRPLVLALSTKPSSTRPSLLSFPLRTEKGWMLSSVWIG